MFQSHRIRWASLTLALLTLAGCGSGGPKLFWGVDEGSGKTAPTRHDLTVPPKNGTDLYQPPGDDEAHADPAGADTGSSVAAAAAIRDLGPSVEGRRWTVEIADNRSVSDLWPSVLDAAIDLPLTNIDSAGHVLTTDWYTLFGSGDPGFLGGSTQRQVRYVLMVLPDQTGSTLRIMTFSQARSGTGWVVVKAKQNDLKPVFATLARHGWTGLAPQS